MSKRRRSGGGLYGGGATGVRNFSTSSTQTGNCKKFESFSFLVSVVAKCNKKSSREKNKTRTIIIFRDKMIFSKDDTTTVKSTDRERHTRHHPKGKQKKLYTFFTPDK